MGQIREALKHTLREMLKCFHQGLSSELEQLSYPCSNHTDVSGKTLINL